MDEILQDLAASAEMQSRPENENNMTDGEQSSENASSVDEYLDAPKSYKKEYAEKFKTLAPEWRKYLTEREKETERGFSDFGNKLNGYKWVDSVFQPRSERLSKSGISQPQQYFEALAKIDDAINQDPRGTIKTLIEAYGVNLADDNNSEQNQLQQKISRLEQGFNSLNGFLANQRQAELRSTIESFISAKDEAGNPVHPHFDKVKVVMGQLMKSGTAANIQDAYDKAVWLDPEIRGQLMAEKNDKALKSKVAEAAIAKEAGFDPKSKAVGTKPELSLEEELAQKFDAL